MLAARPDNVRIADRLRQRRKEVHAAKRRHRGRQRVALSSRLHLELILLNELHRAAAAALVKHDLVAAVELGQRARAVALRLVEAAGERRQLHALARVVGDRRRVPGRDLERRKGTAVVIQRAANLNSNIFKKSNSMEWKWRINQTHQSAVLEGQALLVASVAETRLAARSAHVVEARVAIRAGATVIARPERRIQKIYHVRKNSFAFLCFDCFSSSSLLTRSHCKLCEKKRDSY